VIFTWSRADFCYKFLTPHHTTCCTFHMHHTPSHAVPHHMLCLTTNHTSPRAPYYTHHTPRLRHHMPHTPACPMPHHMGEDSVVFCSQVPGTWESDVKQLL
jgi:hypothetical protein